MANQYDRILKENLASLAPALIRLLTGFEFTRIGDEPVEFPETLSLQPDFLHTIRTANGQKALLHIEFQVKMEKDFTARMMLYHALLHRRYLDLPVYQFAVYLGDRKHSVY